MAFRIPTSNKSQPTRTTGVKTEQFTPVTASNNELNRLAPAGGVVSAAPNLVPNSRTLDSTGTSVVRPTPVGKP